MAKKNNNTLWILAGVAVVGYLAFKKGLISLPGTALPAPVNPIQAALPPPPSYQIQDPHQIAVELPDLKDIGIYMPNLDPTGHSITLY